MRTVVAIVLAFVMWACSSEPDTPPRPGTHDPEPEPGYSGITADSRLRVELPQVTLCYGEPGMMYLSEGETASFIDLDGGVRVDFNPSGRALAIDGNAMTITNIKTVKTLGKRSWYVVTLDGGATGVMVTEVL